MRWNPDGRERDIIRSTSSASELRNDTREIEESSTGARTRARQSREGNPPPPPLSSESKLLKSTWGSFSILNVIPHPRTGQWDILVVSIRPVLCLYENLLLNAKTMFCFSRFIFCKPSGPKSVGLSVPTAGYVVVDRRAGSS